jgi:hypothetical protein
MGAATLAGAADSSARDGKDAAAAAAATPNAMMSLNVMPVLLKPGKPQRRRTRAPLRKL